MPKGPGSHYKPVYAAIRAELNPYRLKSKRTGRQFVGFITVPMHLGVTRNAS
jgi:hypothetical protein